MKVFYLGGLFAMPAVEAGELLGLLKFCRERGVVTVVDVVVPREFSDFDQYKSLLPYIDYFLPNDDEARQLTGQADPMDQVRMLLGWGANTVIVTRGDAGPWPHSAVPSGAREYTRCRRSTRPVRATPLRPV